jgi:4-hydroxybenzoate polyprenyltransferase
MSVPLASVEALPWPVTTRKVTQPLCVDLDGTLILTDVLLESLMLLIRRNPFYLFLIALWLLRGRSVLKTEVAVLVILNAGALPYDREFVCGLESERSAGRSLWLCTASNEMLAARVASHLGLFEGVLASGREGNRAGAATATGLVQRFFEERGFDYCGSAWRDIEIWKRARGAIVVRGGRRLERDAALHAPVLRAFPPRANTSRAIIRALRPHQWVKNVVILVPLLAAHRVSEPAGLAAGLLAIAVFCLCASSVYVVNDLLDLEADRAHIRKSKRPFAAGDLSLLTGFALAPSLLGAAFLMSALLPTTFQLALATYYAVTAAYSFALKEFVLIDAVTLAGLYTLRIVAGAAAVGVPLSFWMLLFSVFLFLSLAFVKRFAELDALRRQQRLRGIGRGYEVDDLSILQSLRSAAGYLSVLILRLYINSPEIETLYRRPKVIWMLCADAVLGQPCGDEGQTWNDIR